MLEGPVAAAAGNGALKMIAALNQSLETISLLKQAMSAKDGNTAK